VGQAFRFPGRFSKIDEFLSYFDQFLRSQYLKGRHVLLIIDEAQKLSPKILEQTRLLSNISAAGENLVSIFLVGQNELNKNLLSSQSRALRQRITIHYQLKPLSPVETDQYCRHRLNMARGRSDIFNPQAIKEIHRLSGGYPRLINIICERALVAGYVNEQPIITPPLITECARELMLPGEFELGSTPVRTVERTALPAAAPALAKRSRVRSIHHLVKERAKKLQTSVTGRLAAGPWMWKPNTPGGANGSLDSADEISVFQDGSQDHAREIINRLIAEKNKLGRSVHRTASRILDSGLGNTALAVGSVALALIFSIWYQGIMQPQSNGQHPGSLSMQPVPAAANIGKYREKTDRFDADKTVAPPGKQYFHSKLTETVPAGSAAEHGGNSRSAQKAKPDREKNVGRQIVPINAAFKFDRLNKIAVEKKAYPVPAPEIEPPMTSPSEMASISKQTTDAGQSAVGKSSSSPGFSRQSNTAYALQVGAFLIKENAARRLEILKKSGYPAAIVNFVDSKGRRWYSVRLGKYLSLEVAKKQADDFTAKEKMDSVVRPVGRF
jgi:cell division protein FtsN